MQSSEEVIIRGPKVHPFADRQLVVCPACGISATSRWRRLIRKIKGKKEELVAKVTWCPGEKPPTERTHVFEALMTGRSESTNICAGVMLPHLHLTCNTCGARWLSEPKSR